MCKCLISDQKDSGDCGRLDRNAIIRNSKKKARIANKVILKEYTNRVTRQSIRITGNQSLIESHPHTEQKGVIDSMKSLFSGASGGK